MKRKMLNKKYVVEMVVGGEFEVAFHWVDDEDRSNGTRKPMLFDSIDEAQKEIDDCIASCEEAVNKGNMDTSFRDDEYCIREASEEEIDEGSTYVVLSHYYNTKEAMEEQDSRQTYDEWEIFESKLAAIAVYRLKTEAEEYPPTYLRSAAVARIIEGTDW